MPRYTITKRARDGRESIAHYHAAPGRELEAAANAMCAMSCGRPRDAAHALRTGTSYTASSRAGDFFTVAPTRGGAP